LKNKLPQTPPDKKIGINGGALRRSSVCPKPLKGMLRRSIKLLKKNIRNEINQY